MAQSGELKSGELTSGDGVRGAWPVGMTLAELGKGRRQRLVADEATLQRVARVLELDELKALEAELDVTPWLDGARICGRWKALVVQTCGVSLEPFETALEGEFEIRAVPPESPALGDTPEHELDLDLGAEDPPEAIEGGRMALGAYVVEDLALAIDPFPRKPGVAFEPPDAIAEPSPFAALIRLKTGERET